MDNKTPSAIITPQTLRGAHVIALPSVADGGVLPAWVEMLPAGEFSGRDGRGPYRADFLAIQQSFAAWGMPISGDYEHQSLNTVDNGQPAPASGWGYEFDERNGAVWCRVEWNGPAAAWIASNEYRYLSPVFDYYPDGTIFRITGFALTNNPNLFLTAVARREAGDHSQEHTTMAGIIDQERASDLLRGLIYRLSLPETSTPDEVLAAVTRVTDSLKSTQAAMAVIRTSLSLSDNAAPEAIATAAQSRLSGSAPNPADFVPRAEFERVSHSLAAIQQDQRQKDVEGAVSAAMTAGKVSPSMGDWARAYASRDMEGFREYVNSAPVIVPTNASSAHSTRTGSPAGNQENPLLADAHRRAGK